jgi:uncharacterized membrane protein
MRTTNAFWIAAAMVMATNVVALWAWYSLPAGAGVPINYLALDGLRHHGVTRAGLWLVPVISALTVTGMTFAPLVGMQRQMERGRQVFEAILIGMPGLLLVVQAALVARAMDADFNVLRPVAVATGVLLLAVGNYLGKARQNGFIGLKTPWTLADAGVWDKTHRLTGRGLFLGGLILVTLGFVLHEAVALGLAIAACTALPMLIGVASSWRLYRALPRG